LYYDPFLYLPNKRLIHDNIKKKTTKTSNSDDSGHMPARKMNKPNPDNKNTKAILSHIKCILISLGKLTEIDLYDIILQK